MPLTLANKITIFRILCVPVFILLITYYNMSVKESNPQAILRWSATILFFCTMFLDAVDGYIARTRGQITRLGTIIDPLADKALLISSLVILSKSLKVLYCKYPCMVPVDCHKQRCFTINRSCDNPCHMR